MHKVLLLGAGKIGRMITKLLVESGDYDVLVADAEQTAIDRLKRQTADVPTAIVDATEPHRLKDLMRGREIVISALSFHFNPQVAECARDAGASYFDLTEDRETTAKIREIAAKARAGQVFVPQCGLAPGFISIVAQHLTRSFDEIDSVRMRVGALPQFPSNPLRYNLTWSTDGLINEYCNPCDAIHDGRHTEALPLEGLEQFSLDGVIYEAFNTSGGLGTLCDSLAGQVRELNYKTVRYRGHQPLMKFLIHDLDLGRRRAVLKDILEHAIPVTFQDVVVMLCTVSGWRGEQLVQASDARKIYPTQLDGLRWSAIQTTTAAGLCAVLDMHRDSPPARSGLVRQEEIDFKAFLANRFGRLFDAPAIHHLSPSADPLEVTHHA
jgi:saccharopine dehydrogenase-like NADP-dependent oxidoreductase